MGGSFRLATSEDLDAAAKVLAAAFEEYAWTRWSIPSVGYHDLLEELQFLYLSHAREQGVVLVHSEGCAVAAFLPPGAPELPEVIQRRVAELHGERLPRLMALDLPAVPADAWTLATVGVDPAYQGQGWGTAAISAGLAMIDARATTVALETSDIRNESLYERLGFRTVATTAILGGPVVYSMRRTVSPRATSGEGYGCSIEQS